MGSIKLNAFKPAARHKMRFRLSLSDITILVSHNGSGINIFTFNLQHPVQTMATWSTLEHLGGYCTHRTYYTRTVAGIPEVAASVLINDALLSFIMARPWVGCFAKICRSRFPLWFPCNKNDIKPYCLLRKKKQEGIPGSYPPSTVLAKKNKRSKKREILCVTKFGSCFVHGSEPNFFISGGHKNTGNDYYFFHKVLSVKTPLGDAFHVLCLFQNFVRLLP